MQKNSIIFLNIFRIDQLNLLTKKNLNKMLQNMAFFIANQLA